MASATENSSSATVSSEPVSAAKAASACRSTSAKEVEEVPRITGPYRVAAWDDSRSSRKRSITRRERSSSLSDSPTIFEARSLARSPTSPRSWVEAASRSRSEEHTSELQSRGHLVCRLLLEKKKKIRTNRRVGCEHKTPNHLSSMTDTR